MFEAAATPDGFFSKVMRTTLLTGNPTDNCTASIPPNCVIPNPVPQSGNPCTCGAQAAPPSNAANPTPQPAIAISDGFDILAWNIQRGRDFGVARKKHTDSYYCHQPYFPLSTQFFAHCYFRTPHEITRLFPAWAAYYKFARRNREMGNRNQPKKLKRWRDVARVVHDPNLVMPALRQLYKSPKDIDIYIGGLLERPPTRVGRFRQRRQRNVNGNRGRRGIRRRGGGQFRGLGVGRRRSKSGFIF